ncbi:MAG TPA: FAD:protein FMN transferase ApbE [Planctomycetaceae bacterium]|nr:FAD:protein FMN transferase ApbE [Planctomycetaceae bacterium]
MFGNIFWNVVRFGLAAAFLVLFFYLALAPKTYYTDAVIEGDSMGTFYSIKVSGIPMTVDNRELSRAIQETLDRIDRAMSTYKPDSEVCRFNASDSTDWFPVSPETAAVVSLALDISTLTDGAFDITVAPLVQRWGFGAGADSRSRPPGAEELETVRNTVGFRHLRVHPDSGAIKKDIPELQIDLSAVAKGYAVDQVARTLDTLKIDSYMIDIGGEVRCRGAKMDGSPWRIGIEVPQPDVPGADPNIFMAVELKDVALATSGDYRDFQERDGVRYSHIIDPRTGEPTERTLPGEAVPTERLGSVSILDPSCARADALATAFFVLGEIRGLELAERAGIPALFLSRSTDVSKPIRKAASQTFPR